MPATQTLSLLRVGLLIPSSNTVMERDLRSSLADVADLYAARMQLVETTEGAEAAMLDSARGSRIGLEAVRSARSRR